MIYFQAARTMFLKIISLFWAKKNNPEPWNQLDPNDQYKFYSVKVDYRKLNKEGPDF